MTGAKTYYEAQFDRIEEIRRAKRVDKIIAKASERRFESVKIRGNRQAWLIAPDLGFPVKFMDVHMSEIPPGSHTGMHRHMCEAVIYIVKGQGYSLIGEEKYEWEEGDGFCVPTFLWHQHFNSDPRETAVYLAVTTNPMCESLGIAKFEHHEEALPGKNE